MMIKFLKNLFRPVYYNEIKCKIPGSVKLGHHGLCVVIGRDVIIGENVHISQGVTIGKRNGEMPVIEDNVKIFSNAVVLGGITIGEGSVIGAGSVVLKDVPPYTVVTGVWK